MVKKMDHGSIGRRIQDQLITTMAATPTSKTNQELLILGPPALYKTHTAQLSSKFKLLKPFQSTLPLSNFLDTKAQTTTAVLCAGMFTLSSDVIRRLPSLRLVVTTSAGVNNVDLAECRIRGIAVVNATDIFSADVADFAVGLVLDVLRKVSVGNRFVKGGSWIGNGDCFPLGIRLSGKRVGIVGLGSIGLEVAKRLEAFNCTISYTSRKRKPTVPYSYESNIQELASKSDILILSCALNEETRHLINRDVLLALGKEGVIVNIARGGVIDERELIRCLEAGDIAGAGLDVFENEPNVPKELFELDNVVLSPHSAVFTEESFGALYEHVCGNLEAFFSNKPLTSLVSDV